MTNLPSAYVLLNNAVYRKLKKILPPLEKPKLIALPSEEETTQNSIQRFISYLSEHGIISLLGNTVSLRSKNLYSHTWRLTWIGTDYGASKLPTLPLKRTPKVANIELLFEDLPVWTEIIGAWMTNPVSASLRTSVCAKIWIYKIYLSGLGFIAHLRATLPASLRT